MPNSFDDDQLDPDLEPETEPHQYDDKRIRCVVGDYRVVIPDGVQKGRRFFTNDSPMVIEKRSKDAAGAVKWDRVTSLSKPGPKNSVKSCDHAVYWLLAGPDAE